MDRLCSLDGCEARTAARGLCAKHYKRLLRHGSPTAEQRIRFDGTPEERFWKRVIKSEGCWEWNGSKHRFGYGRFGDGVGVTSAHRYCWEITNGPIPKGMCVCHRCDNPSCVRPDHLFLGTVQENLGDMFAKGRNNPPRGERAATSRLTTTDVLRIREMYASGRYTQREIGDTFGIANNTVSQIVTRRHWAHI